MNAVGKFTRALECVQLPPSDLSWFYIKLAGEHPDSLHELDAILPDDTRTLVQSSVNDAPQTAAEWSDYHFVVAGCDTEEMTRAIRLGVEAIRNFQNSS